MPKEEEQLELEIEQGSEKEEEVQLSPGEEKARRDGWLPKEEFSGDEETWFDWPEFNRRSELFGKISTLNKSNATQSQQIEKLSKAVAAMAEHNKKLAELHRKERITELKAQKAAALEESDHAAVVEIDEQLAEVKDAKVPEIELEDVQDTGSNKGPAPEIVEWMKENKWYNTNEHMTTFAEGVVLKAQAQKLPVNEMLALVDLKVREAFPHNFGKATTTVNKVAGNTGGKGKPNGKSKFTVANLNPMQKEMGETFVESGAIKDMQTYVDQLAELGELG